ncbi:hypothetical protein PMI41_02551, partial [Phyllobacterium sp. YR531]
MRKVCRLHRLSPPLQIGSPCPHPTLLMVSPPELVEGRTAHNSRPEINHETYPTAL